jgi:putative transposase
MSVSSEVDPQGGEGPARVAGVAAQGGGEVDRPRPAEHADHQVAQHRHDVWRGTGADLGGEVHRCLRCRFLLEGFGILRTPVRAPRGNALAERWVGTVRRELLDRMLVVGRRHLETALSDYATRYNRHRPHRALGQAAPLGAVPEPVPPTSVRVLRPNRLGGVIHEFAQVA